MSHQGQTLRQRLVPIFIGLFCAVVLAVMPLLWLVDKVLGGLIKLCEWGNTVRGRTGDYRKIITEGHRRRV